MCPRNGRYGWKYMYCYVSFFTDNFCCFFERNIFFSLFIYNSGGYDCMYHHPPLSHPSDCVLCTQEPKIHFMLLHFTFFSFWPKVKLNKKNLFLLGGWFWFLFFSTAVTMVRGINSRRTHKFSFITAPSPFNQSTTQCCFLFSTPKALTSWEFYEVLSKIILLRQFFKCHSTWDYVKKKLKFHFKDRIKHF